MYSLLYFDTEDYFSPPDSPVHLLPKQFADIMHKHGLAGCFHIHGEKARFMERHHQAEVIEAVKKHDVSLHYDRGSVHPTTAEEVSNLSWFEGVDRALFRELPGFQTLERVFGKCSGLTQHGGTFAAQIVYAAGKMGYPFFYSPFRLPGHGVCWFCNNLLLAGAQQPSSLDQTYRDTPRFEKELAKVGPYLTEQAGTVDFSPKFGCHPVITVMEKFPDKINFDKGASPPRAEWKPPVMIEGVDIPLIMRNFERYIVKLVNHPDVKWTTVAGIRELYGHRPVRVEDAAIVEGAEKVIENRGPTFTHVLTAGELLFLLAVRHLARSETYEVPQIMGPSEEDPEAVRDLSRRKGPDLDIVSREIFEAGIASGYLPAALSERAGKISPEVALVMLACRAVGRKPSDVSDWDMSVEAIPGIREACERVEGYKRWLSEPPQRNVAGITRYFRLQAWTLKPAFTPDGYPDAATLGPQLNAMIA